MSFNRLHVEWPEPEITRAAAMLGDSTWPVADLPSVVVPGTGRCCGTPAGSRELLDDERDFQKQVLAGSPPLGLGAPPLDRLIAYGRARIDS